MRNALFLAAAALSLAAVACSKNDNADPADANIDLNANMATNDMAMNDMNAMDGMNMANGMATAPMAGPEFAATVAGSDMFEIAAGKLAQTMATMEECKKFGSMLVTDHTKSSAALKAAASSASPPMTVAAAMPAELQGKLDALRAAKGPAFDKLFIQQMKESHQNALATLQSYASGGDVSSLKAFAGKTAPVVKGHLDMLNSMKM